MTELIPPDMNPFWKHIFTTMVVVFGAVVHATAKLKIARDNRDDRFNHVDFIVLFIVASFAGMVFSFLARFYFENEYIINFCASIGSFLGIAGVNAVGQAFLEILIAKLPKGK